MSVRIQEGNSQLKIDRLDGGGIPVYHFKGNPFTGTVFQYHKDEVTLAWEQDYEKGYQEGWVRLYFPSGKKRQEYKTYNNEEIDGTFREWDVNGDLILSY